MEGRVFNRGLLPFQINLSLCNFSQLPAVGARLIKLTLIIRLNESGCCAVAWWEQKPAATRPLVRVWRWEKKGNEKIRWVRLERVWMYLI